MRAVGVGIAIFLAIGVVGVAWEKWREARAEARYPGAGRCEIIKGESVGGVRFYYKADRGHIRYEVLSDSLVAIHLPKGHQKWEIDPSDLSSDPKGKFSDPLRENLKVGRFDIDCFGPKPPRSGE